MKAVKILFGVLSFIFIIYISIPSRGFPVPPPDALQSQEPADTENKFRKAYFTNLTREEVVKHYQEAMKVGFLGIYMPTLRLNYPPEDAYTIIRDQTRSTFLEEVLHPYRESVFVNGFEPKSDKDAIIVENKKWRQKITVRYVPSSPYVRVAVGLLTIVLIVSLFKFGKTIYHPLKRL